MSRPSWSRSAGNRETRLRLPCAPLLGRSESRAATCWSPLDACRTPPELVLRKPVSNWTDAATFVSMAGWRRARRTYGRWGNAPAAPNSPTYPKTIFESCAIISPEEVAARAIWLVPYSMFTDPPLARVGLSEGQAERQGLVVRVAKLPMDAVLGAQATDQRQGFMKALVGDMLQSHPGLHHDRSRGQRGHGRNTSTGNVGRPFLLRPSATRPCPPDDGGRAELPVFERTAARRGTDEIDGSLVIS